MLTDHRFIFAGAISALFAFGCSTTESSSTVETDASVSDAATSADTDASNDAAADSGAQTEDASADASTTSYKECTDDELNANPVFTGGADISFFNAGVDGGALAYTNNCIRIPVGQNVGWYGDFEKHPLANNGEPGTPIPNLTTGNDSGRIVFPTAGKYSFHCDLHPATMYGTVLVQ